MKTKLFIFAALFGALFMMQSCDEDDSSSSKILINKITVTKFPANDSLGSGWDASSGADIFPKVLKGGTVLWDSPQYKDNANPSVDYEYIPSPPIELSSLNEQYTIELYDRDSTLIDETPPDDWMGGIDFIPSSFINGAPASFTLDGEDSVTFEIFIDYVY